MLGVARPGLRLARETDDAPGRAAGTPSRARSAPCALAAQRHGDECSRVLNCAHPMDDAPGKIEELARLQDMRATIGRDVDGALDALDGDLPRHAVGWQRLAGPQNQAHDLEIRGLEERNCLRLWQAGAEGPNVYGLPGLGMRECHGREYALVSSLHGQRGERGSRAPRGPGALRS